MVHLSYYLFNHDDCTKTKAESYTLLIEGFEEVAHFSNFFKKQTDCSPLTFRNQKKVSFCKHCFDSRKYLPIRSCQLCSIKLKNMELSKNTVLIMHGPLNKNNWTFQKTCFSFLPGPLWYILI
ncbi:hypothetical protein DDR33_18405 [Pararcticibacter amylolyticus]|uniref:HTH araC/xylS-type domain-containing protein n=1 Tax=Pararcticibacter amylolyticus TaxID=2173175 RepID=A0A2U2PCZ2_9SPHI|nr:hypothetical protein DDR33_18405 [Pararcticibacter amylolyticus]